MDSKKNIKKFLENNQIYEPILNKKGLDFNVIRRGVKYGATSGELINDLLLNKNSNKYKKAFEEYKQLETKNYNKIIYENRLNKNFVDSNKIKIDFNKIVNEKYSFITHKIEFDRIMKKNPNCYYVQVVKFYDGNGKLINETPFENKYFSYINNNNKKYKSFIEKVFLNMTYLNYEWFPIALINWDNDLEGLHINNPNEAYTIIETTAYKKEVVDKVKLKQVYRDNNTGHCVYDALEKYFFNKKDKDRNAKAIYNKLIKNEKLKKEYTDDNINEIVKFCNSTLVIKDLINGEDKEFKNEYSRFHIELINTKFNHLDLLINDNKIEYVEKEKYYKLKDELPFYIEKYGLLITTDKTYKIKDNEFKIVFNEWKKNVNYDKLFITQDSKEYSLISEYDYNLHSFINDFEINNDLYNELDIVKAYYNYHKNTFYNGLPSGSFINVKLNDNFNFNDLYNNNLIGFFEVEIKNIINKIDHCNKLGFFIGKKYVLSSCQIKFLMQFIDFKFLNGSYCPSVHIPFNYKFLEKENGIKHYCKAFGLMLSDNDFSDINIKPLKCDTEYYNVINNDNYDIYNVNGIINIYDKSKVKKSYLHIGYYIHSYTKTTILEQLFKMDLNNVFGIKLDSIVFKKEYEFDYNKEIFGDKFKEAKIEGMIKKNGLDEGIFSTYGYYRNYFLNCNIKLNFEESFLYTGDLIKNRVVYIGGAGGSGKTSSLLNALPLKYTVYSANSWNLIQGKKKDNINLLGYSLPNLTGFCGEKQVEKIENPNIKYIILDEATLNDSKIILKIIKEYYYCYIFILGDVDFNGFFYQCSLNNIQVLKPCEINCQYVKYIKSYRFNNELLNKLEQIREIMRVKGDVYKFVLDNFKFYNKKDVVFNDNDIGITAINDYENNNNELSEYFFNKGTKKQYFVKTTDKHKGLLRGSQLEEKPDHNNYECKLFKTIHSFQGLDLGNDNKIIISITKNFDYNLLYTAISRARRTDQIIFLEGCHKKMKTKN